MTPNIVLLIFTVYSTCVLAIMSGDPPVTSVSIHSNKPNTFVQEKPCSANASKDESFNCSKANSAPSSNSPARQIQCGSNSMLTGESCVCKEGHVKFSLSENLCVKREGQPCMFSRNDCNTEVTYMSCVNHRCACEESDYYDGNSMRCAGKVGGMCYTGIKDCVVNAECVKIPQSSYYYQTDDTLDFDYVLNSNSDIELSGRCQCKQGFVETEQGLCKIGYGQPCAFADECDRLNLVCKEGICDCPDSLQVFDYLSKSCVALVGAKCSNDFGGTLCIKNGRCEKLNLKLAGRCICEDDAVETNRRTCARVQKRDVSVEQETPLPSPRIMFNLN